ncbi:acyltransferase family protein [Dyadobacter psychrotolerans]|uniref:Acyltransferase n=1 Tax=Dyadobacter psychrotolerans TaxID=2541721 RepID=A0A4R5DPR1_9BACT|nr:acyltransferase [Dyadobacter psychrotolerans]TDE12763.1 acyltransferase [Dyadobacter psychrotolerans]
MSINFKKGHINSLDGIRGIGILLVLSFHCCGNINVYPLNFISEIGWVGVDLFFVLSGFLITGILIDAKGKENYFKFFFIKRALRIFPLYYLTLFVVFMALTIPGINNINPVFDKRLIQDSVYYLTFTPNLLFSFKGWGVTDLLNHFWSLAIEEQFYLVCPFIIFYLDTPKALGIFIALIVTALSIRNYNVNSDFSYVFTFSRLDALSTGSILAILIRKHNNLVNKIALPIFLTTIISLSIICYISPNLYFRNPYFVRGGYTLFALLFASIIAFIYDTKQVGIFINRILSFKFLTFFGTYSYGIYIYHWLLYRGVYVYLENKYVFSKAYIILFLFAVVLVSVISYHTFEIYFLRFKYRLTNRPEYDKLV